MSGDYFIQAKYGGIQDYHDGMNRVSGHIADSQDGCRQLFNALAPICVGDMGDTAQQVHQQGMQKFDGCQSDWHAVQRQSVDQVQGLATLDSQCGASIGGF